MKKKVNIREVVHYVLLSRNINMQGVRLSLKLTRLAFAYTYAYVYIALCMRLHSV